jgi:hypothetical protein
VAHATSADGCHFDDQGMAWQMPPFPELCLERGLKCTEGTSSVFVHPRGATAAARRGRKKYSINCSLCRSKPGFGIQNISFAESDDPGNTSLRLSSAGAAARSSLTPTAVSTATRLGLGGTRSLVSSLFRASPADGTGTGQPRRSTAPRLLVSGSRKTGSTGKHCFRRASIGPRRRAPRCRVHPSSRSAVSG